MTRLVGCAFMGLALSAAAISAQSDELRTLRRVTAEDGLSHSTVFDVAEDSTERVIALISARDDPQCP